MDPWMKWGALCLLHNPMARSQDRSLSLTRPLVFSGRVNRVFGKYAEMDTCQPSKFIVYILYIYIHTHVDKQFTYTVYSPIYCCFYVFQKEVHSATSPGKICGQPPVLVDVSHVQILHLLVRQGAIGPRLDFTVKHGEFCKQKEQDI